VTTPDGVTRPMAPSPLNQMFPSAPVVRWYGNEMSGSSTTITTVPSSEIAASRSL